ncbi:MAG: efflux RND transporter permease subunit [Planctomycetaceae bacterium]
MIDRILKFCIAERLVMTCLCLLVLAYGWFSFQRVPIDAIPNIGENQVIVFTSWPGRSPKDIEDQITYPLSISLLAVPDAESVRGKSLFGYSFVQVTFSDDTDFYWARSRVSEQLGTAASTLPDGSFPLSDRTQQRRGADLLLHSRCSPWNGSGRVEVDSGLYD